VDLYYASAIDTLGVQTTVTASSATSPVYLSGLVPGTTYQFTVYSSNTGGQSTATSSGSNLLYQIGSIPGAPTAASAALTPAGNPTGVLISFTAPSNLGGGVSSYTATAFSGATPISSASGAASPLTITGLTAGTSYTYSVVATNSYGNSPASTTTILTIGGTWVQFDFGTAKALGSYNLACINAASMTGWTIAGSNDDSSWSLIDRVIGVNIYLYNGSSGYSKTILPPYRGTAYRYMRWICETTTDTNYIFNHYTTWRDTADDILTATVPGQVTYSSGANDIVPYDNSGTIYLNGSNINWLHVGNYGSGSYSGPTTTAMASINTLTLVYKTLPGAPANVSGTLYPSVTPTGINVSFSSPANLGGEAVIYYASAIDTLGVRPTVTASSGTSPIYLTGLVAGTTYRFTVYSSNTIGQSTTTSSGSNLLYPSSSTSRVFHVRYEGTAATSGAVGSPNIVIGYTFYENAPGDIYVNIESNARGTGVSGVYTVDTLVSSFPSVQGGTSYKISGNTISSVGYTAPQSNLPNLIVNGSYDDNYTDIGMPWNVTFLGVSYSNVYLGSNTYLTFGAGSTNYYALSESNPYIPKIMTGCADNSYQRVYTGTF
jgi:hypothetical protein